MMLIDFRDHALLSSARRLRQQLKPHCQHDGAAHRNNQPVGRLSPQLAGTGRIDRRESATTRPNFTTTLWGLHQRRTRHHLALGTRDPRTEGQAVVCGVLALPGAQVWPFGKTQHWAQEIRTSRGVAAMDAHHRWMEVVIYATLAALPAISVPTGLGAGGLPMGLQLIGRPRGDLVLLGLAVTPPALQVE